MSGFAAIEEGDNHSFWYNKTISTDESGSGKAGRSSNFNFNRLFEATVDYAVLGMDTICRRSWFLTKTSCTMVWIFPTKVSQQMMLNTTK
ncbi:MAG: hypothetical protein H6543_03040 [Prevotellaceae bacterium]|nr:hypothetical protein [Prevotellaceae bacterium]